MCLAPRALVLLLALAPRAHAATPGWYRDPALHDDTVVFTSEGDLWRVSRQGGVAQRLTSHPAEESQAMISPDGRSVAFVASYDGAPDVYLMPIEGGEPRRLSFDGGRVWTAGFTPRGEVVYTSENEIGPTLMRMLRVAAADGSSTRVLPLADAREVAFDATGTWLWFTRYGLQVNGDNARDYRGGAMAQLWRWRVDAKQEAERVADRLHASVERPMWWDGRLHAVSDAGGRANLWRLGRDGDDPAPLTAHTEFDVRGARLQDGRIVYQLGADLRIFDLRDGSDRVIPITLGSDLGQRRVRFVPRPLTHLGSASVAHDGSRAVLSARGQVAIASSGPRRRVELVPPRGTRLREAVLSVDGRHVYAIVDGDGRSEIRRFAADGSGPDETLAADAGTQRWHLYPSPDGRSLAHDDNRGQLWLLDLDSGRNRRIDAAEHARDDAYERVSWSADGRYLALARIDSARLRRQIVLIDARSGRRATLTSDRYESYSPTFSPDGRWLWFLSDRSFQSSVTAPWGDRNTGPFFDRRTRIYAFALQSGSRFPFQAADELAPATDTPAEEAARDAGRAGGSRPPPAPPGVEFEGLALRLHEVPIEAGNYAALAAHAERLYFLQREADPDAKAELRVLPITDRDAEAETFLEEIRDYALSGDGRRLLVIKAGKDATRGAPPGDLLLLDAQARTPNDVAAGRLQLEDWTLRIDPADEWRQMFDDAWRMHRQFAFDPQMRGVDWDAVKARFAPLLARVHERGELDDLLAQMSAELGVLHSQVRGSQLRTDPEAPQGAALGARLGHDADGVWLERIYRTDPETPSERGPLQQPGVDAREGDRLHAINGHAVRDPGDVADRLRQQAGRQVLLTLARGDREHRTVVVPVRLDRDAQLRYGDWVWARRERVDAAASGRIGYLHLRAMGAADIAQFTRDFYAQVDREGLIIDVRRNRGGNIDSWIIGTLLRRVWSFWQPPRGAAYGNMQQSFRGHLAVLADPLTYSDGETFAAGVKALALGPVIGQRTSGAGVWLSDRNRLADNGLARVAEFGVFDLQGRWMVEGRGVAPDIAVDNLPWATARGGDAQLDAAIAHLQQRLREQPIPPLRAGPVPPLGTPGHDGGP